MTTDRVPAFIGSSKRRIVIDLSIVIQFLRNVPYITLVCIWACIAKNKAKSLMLLEKWRTGRDSNSRPPA